MKRLLLMTTVAGLVSMISALHADTGKAQGGAATTTSSVTIAAYYFPNYHPGDARNSRDSAKGPGWSEWDLVKAARPRYPGHYQPQIPLWGYEDESNPEVFARKIDAAADHNVDAFIFDWYYYNDGPFLNKALDRGYLKAPNRDRLKFALMWANHDWLELHPHSRGTTQTLLYPGAVTPESFTSITDHVIRDYFRQPTYWTIDGKPYFSIYQLDSLMKSYPTVEACRAALDDFRNRTKAAGFPGLHLNAVTWGNPILPGETAPSDMATVIKRLGFDSATSYVWIHHVPLPDAQTSYTLVRDQYLQWWDKAITEYPVPYYPNATVGWDSSPRTNQNDEWGNWGYPFTNNIEGTSPASFREALEMINARMAKHPTAPPILTINSWNEWTEGSYLEPNTRFGMKYLEAIRDTFPKSR